MHFYKWTMSYLKKGHRKSESPIAEDSGGLWGTKERLREPEATYFGEVKELEQAPGGGRRQFRISGLERPDF